MLSRLIIFDVDGTLAEKYSSNLLPGVKTFFNRLKGCAERPCLAIATNQGGVGMRRWMETRHFGKPERYPAQADVEQRLEELRRVLDLDEEVPVYISFRYQTREGRWAPLPPEGAGDPRWTAEWRKPNPGMLLQAMADAGVGPDNTLFVGDSPDDQQAAQAAGCAFQWASDFFSQE